MDYAGQSLEHLLRQYHTSTDSQIISDIEKIVKSRKIDIDDMALINNAFYYFMDIERRAGLRNWVLGILRESAIITETYDLLNLYESVSESGVLAYFINQHLRERIVTSNLWHKVIMGFEHLSSPLTGYGAKFILQCCNDPYILAEVHFYTGIRSKMRLRLTEKILAMQGEFSYNDWHEIATRCAHPSSLWIYANNEMDEAYYADEEDLPRYPKKKKK